MASGFIRGASTNIAAAQVINATTGLAFVGTVTVYVTVDTGTQAIGTVGSGIATAKGNGVFEYIPSAAESNGTICLFTFTGANAIPSSSQYWTISAGQSTAIQIASNPAITPLTAVSLITRSLKAVGVLSSGDTPSGDMITDGFLDLNEMMGSLAIQPQTIGVIAREEFALVSGQGGPSTPYTIGPGGNFNTSRPADLEGAGILLGGTPPLIEVPRAIYTDDAYEAVAIKELQSSIFTGVYYNQTFSAGLGEINLWPVPNTALNSLVLYRSQQLETFSSLTATYYVANGYAEMLRYQLALRLAIVFQKPISQDVQRMADLTLANVKRSNYKLSDLPTDPALTSNLRGGYNILTGSGG